MKISKSQLIIGLTLVGYLAVFLFIIKNPSFFNNYDKERGFPIDNNGDSVTYVKLAENIINNKIYSNKTTPPFTPHQKFPPGYPIFLAIILYIFKSYKAIALVQIILTGIGLIFLYKISLQLIPAQFAFLPLIIMAANPATAFYTLTALSENLFVFFVIVALFLAIASPRKNNAVTIALVGVVLGCATLTRPAGILLPLFAAAIIYLNHQKTPFKIIAVKIIILMVAYTTTLSPWLIRDYFTYQSYQSPTPTTRINDYVKIIKDKSQYKEELYFIPYFMKTTSFFYFPNLKRQSPKYLFPKYKYIFWYLVSLLTLDTIFNIRHYSQRKLLIILFSITLYFAIISSPFPNPRFRFPAEPILALLAGLSLAHLIHFSHKKLIKIYG